MAIQERNVQTASRCDQSVHRSLEGTTLPPIKSATQTGPEAGVLEDGTDLIAQRISIEDSPNRNLKMRTKKKS